MNASLISQIKSHPLLFALSIGLHLVLLGILTVSLSHTTAPKMPPEKKVDTVKAVAIDASVVEKEVQKLRKAEEKEKQKKLAQKKQLEREARKAREKRLKEEKRLADLKKKEQKRKQELARKEKAEKERKKKELAKLKKQKEELERKNRAEKERLAALEKKRKAEEAEALRKKQAAEAEARRKQQEAEMRRQMLEEERRMAKRSAENQKLLAQYIYQIQQRVEANWQAPVSMTEGWSCEVMVEQNRFGEVQSVQMKKCTGSDAFKSTVERAVKKASPLPEAPNNDVFEKKLNFIFRPEV